MDSFYKVLDEKQIELASENEYNFDHPDAFDYDLMCATIRRLKEGKSVEVPVYNFSTHSREKHKVMMNSTCSVRTSINKYWFHECVSVKES